MKPPIFYILILFALNADPTLTEASGLRETVELLSSFGSRLSGYPGAEAAADYVENRLRDMGLESVTREPFEITVPIDRGGELYIGENIEPYTLYGLWPNLVRTPTLPPEGYRGEMIYGGGGEWADLNGLEVEGRVVLMEFNSWHRWLQPASLGARAIVFIEPEETTGQQGTAKYSTAPLDIPRFWIDRASGLQLKEQLLERPASVLIKGRMDWERKTAWNIWAKIPGSDPEYAGENILIESYYDGMSVVPALAPAAETASSIAALLELAEHLVRNPPRRTVYLAATGAHFQAQQGLVHFIERHARIHPYYAQRMDKPFHPKLFICLDLSSQSDELGLWNNTFSYDLKRFFVPFARRFITYAEEEAALLGQSQERALVNGISPIRGMDWSTFVPGGIRVSGMHALAGGLVSLSLVTVNDGRYLVDTPLDVPERMKFENLERQSALLNSILARALNDTALFTDLEDFGPVLKDNLRSLEVKLRAFPRRSQVPDRPIPDGLVVIAPWLKSHKGVRIAQYHLTDGQGRVKIDGLETRAYPLAAYQLDPHTGEIIYAPDLSSRGLQKVNNSGLAGGWMLNKKIRWKTNDMTIVLFPSISQAFYSLIDPRYLKAFGGIKIIDKSGVAPSQFGLARGLGDGEAVGVLFGPQDAAEDDGLKMVIDNRLLLLNGEGSETEDQARGKGYVLGRDSLIRTGMLAVEDMWRLNEARLRTMREHAIENQRLNRLHRRGKVLIEGAKEAEEARDWERYVAQVRAALGVTTRAYPEVKETLNDVISGMVFFLALVIPTAFLGERLLFAAADIRLQLTGFGGLLLLIWIAISQVHPAFSIAHPLVILLAFAIMAMAAFVMSMISTRFNRFMREYQTREAHVHETDISRASASYAAFMLGISNMRRRKLRTGLTLLTLVLLTFTVLSFTSFNAQVRYMAFEMDHEGAYEGVLIRDRSWSELNIPTLDFTLSHFAPEGVVVPRNWYIAFDDEQKKYIEVFGDTSVVRATGMLGLAPEEVEVTKIDKALVGGSFFARDDEASCLMSEGMARALGIDHWQLGVATVQVFGRDLVVRGLFDSERFDAVHDLDDESLLPADFQMSSAQALGPTSRDEMQITLEDAALEIRPFVHLEADNVLVLPYEFLREAGGTLRSVAVQLEDGADAQELVEDFLLRLAMTLFVGLKDPGDSAIKVFSYTSIGLTNVEGLGALIIPMFIAALIVLNAMMGAVYERFREIGIYSSVGLAPMHIALLFIAEACVYAIIGVTLGYILGQSLGKVFIALDWLQGMNLNYSSISAIVSSLIVMGVVLLSTLYPAKVAARTAVPDTVRLWVPPAPDGDRWEMEFPFMIGEREVTGLCGFLANYFGAYSEESIGDFYAEKVGVVVEEGEVGPTYAVQLLVWLAPFDMGVSQFMQLEFLPTSVRSLYTVEIYIHRISGQDTFWQRVNHRFINGLRKEFLLWHTLNEEDRIYHRQTAEECLANAESEVELVAGEKSL
ncbi:MAG: FtsX-like permease family protein [Candidatus Latescibacterota bacterium]|nr:FtsX-like permease family protein [Candidatus Latescibacterota bacterium]